MRSALMVAEKPSLAASLAKILSNGKNSTRKGSNGACSIHEWVGYFRGENVRFKMTSVCGHVMTLDFIGKYNNWDKVDPVELFTCPTEKKEATPKLKMQSFLHHEAKGCDYLILWLDCDKEGENICFEVMNACKSALSRPLHVPDVVWRAKFSAITDRDIKAAMDNLIKPNENEARSVDARQELDLRIGCAFTRFQTKFFQGKYGDLDASLISYGPCQTPTLGFCVERHDAIQTFKPEPFWYIQVNVDNPNGGEDLTLQWSRSYLFDREIVASLYVEMREETSVEVTNVVTKEKAKQRPQALNTVELMRVGSSHLDMGPHHVMLLAEKLYTQGYISYPRTETTHYPDSFNLLAVLKQQQNSAEVGKEVSNILANGMNKPRTGHDSGDHPPITPMKLAHRNEMDNDMYKIYNYIVRHFLATIEKDCKYLSTTVSFNLKGETFTHTGKTLLDPGYTVVMPSQAISKNEIVPDLNKGDKVRIKLVKLCEGQTSPPSYLSEAELITLMEKHGIGTDASIPVHINNICQRNYVTVVGSRRLVPTTLGIVLVHGYQKIDRELVLPTMRAAIEEQLNLIAHGKVDFNEIVAHALLIFHLKFVYFVQHISNMDQLFEVSFSTLANSGKALSRCGKCRRYMKYVQAKPSRLHCSHCDETYSLPQNGNVRIYKELKCPLDEFEMIYFSTGVKGKSFPLCPYCYNNPPFREMKKGSGCNQCVHPTCAHSIYKTSLSECIQCDEGLLILDPPAAPKWKLVCNKCDVIIHLFENAQKVSIEETNCSCGAQQVKVEYKEDKSKLPNDATEMVGCVFCSPEFLPLVEKHKAIASKPANFARKGGKNARSKHKGKPRPPKDKMAQLAAYFV